MSSLKRNIDHRAGNRSDYFNICRKGLDDQAARVQQAAIDAQQAAIAAIRPGVLAEDIAAAANEVYAERGYQTGYRTGRSIGVAYLEAPELKAGDKTVLQAGMTFAVDGGIRPREWQRAAHTLICVPVGRHAAATPGSRRSAVPVVD